MRVDLLNYLYRNYITYDSLYALTKRGFYAYPEADNINVFIDMHSMLADIFGKDMEIDYNNVSVITSSIINLCAHLRAYYASRHRVWTKIYIVWAWNRPANIRELLPEYNAHTIMAEDAKTPLKYLVEENLKLLEILCPYIPDIYFVNGFDNETAVVINTLIKNPENSALLYAPNMIYSRDAFEYICVATLPQTVMFRPKKYKGQDKSYPVMKSNLLESYLVNELRIKWKNDLPIDYNQFVRTIRYAGLKSRGVTGIMKFKKASDLEVFPHFFTAKEDEIINGLNLATDLDAGMETLMRSPEYSQLYKGIINLYNPDEVRRINDIYFQSCPLDLNNL